MKIRKPKLKDYIQVPKLRRANTGLAPGSLVFTGKKKLEATHVTMIQFEPEGDILEEHVKESLPMPREGMKVTWFDIRGLHNVELISEIGERYNIHSLVLEDVVDTQQRPKFDEYEGGIFFTIQALSFDTENMELKTEHVAIYAGDGFVLSFQEDAEDLFPGVRARIQSGRAKIRRRGADYLAYALLDNIVDHYYLLMDQIEEVLNNLEEEVLSNPNRKSKERIHKLKLQSIQLRKIVSPLREAISRFSRSDNPLIQEGTGVFIRDLYDHVIQIMDTIETYRDVMSGLYDLYLSEISFRMNNVIQLLTIISTIFIPLTFVAGIYGMNFDYMPELHWRYGYFVVLGLMFVLSIGMVFVFRWKKWL